MILVVTQCFPPDQGGIETLMGGLVSALRGVGRDVHVLADRIRSDRIHEATQVSEQTIERFGGIRPWRRWLKRRRAAALLAEGQIQAIIADSWKSLETIPASQRFGKTIPVLVLSHGMEFPQAMSVSKQQRIKKALAKATAIIPVSHFSAALVRPFCDASRLHMIHPPLPAMPETDAGQRAEILKMLGENAGAPRLLTLSRLEPRKGVDQVIRALPELVSQFPNLVYYVGGGGADRVRLEALTHQLGMQAHVRFLGFVPEGLKPALYEAVDLFVMPVRRDGNSIEGFGIVYMEAAYYGIPSLAGSEGGAVDAVLDEQTGLIVDGLDTTAIASKLRRLLGDDALRRKLGDAAKERARRDFSWSHAIKTYIALCDARM